MQRFPVVGDDFGDYTLTGPVGQGGMGTVYAAEQKRLSRTVALKVLAPNLSDSEEYRERFIREAETLSRLDSPHIIHIYDYGEHDGCLYLATQLVRGGDLAQRIRRGPIPRETAIELARQVASGLEDAHAVGVVHRDVKANNVLLREGEEPFAYLCDFGIARSGDTGLTRTGTVIGTWAYLSPERCNGEPATIASDVYALGCLLWTAVTGATPYPGTEVQVAMAHVSAPIPQLPETDRLAQGINAVIRRSMAKTPQERYPSAAAMRLALTDLLAVANEPVEATIPRPPVVPAPPTQVRALPTSVLPFSPPNGPPPADPRSTTARNRTLAAVVLAAVLLVAVIGGAAAIVTRGGGDDSPSAGSAASDPSQTASAPASPVAAAPSPAAASPLGAAPATNRTSQQNLALALGSFDGDGTSDIGIQTYQGAGPVQVLTSSGSSLADSGAWMSTNAFTDAHRLTGDFNGDGRTDVALAEPAANGQDIKVALSGGGSFAAAKTWATMPAVREDQVFYVSGDYDGDGRSDLASFTFLPSTKPPGVPDPTRGVDINVLISTGNGFADALPWVTHLQIDFQETRFVAGDVTGDGRSDLVLSLPRGGGVMLKVLASVGNAFTKPPATWYVIKRASMATTNVLTGDFDGDGVADVVALTASFGAGTEAIVLHSNGTGFTSESSWFRDASLDLQGARYTTGDYDGDGRWDVARVTGSGPDTDVVSVLQSSGGSFTNVDGIGSVGGAPYGSIRLLTPAG